jgi:beta-RFAP synthase
MFSLSDQDPWHNLHGEATLAVRRFGGVGLMVDLPGVQVTLEPAADWSASGPLAERALAFARRFAQSLPAAVLQPHTLRVDHAAPEHLGLGTGTQLGLAVARALALSHGLRHLSAVELAQRVGRGARSALGIHGFAQGGFLIEAGQARTGEISPLVSRLPVPEPWRMVLVLPPWKKGLSGGEETAAFRQLLGRPFDLATTDRLSRIALLGMLPALMQADCAAFGEAVYDFNARVGAVFAAVQGGVYADARIAELVAWLRQHGVHGVGQSSWGPTVFAILPDPTQAEQLAVKIRSRFSLGATEVLVSRACNGGMLD